MSAKIVLPLLSVAAIYFIFYFAFTNGLRTLGDASIAAKRLPGLRTTLRTEYTGLGPVDRVLTFLTAFFWPTVDGNEPGLLLHSVAFSGTYCAAWVLVTMESWRDGNQRTVAAFPMIFGLAAQLLTFGFSMPIYAFLHLRMARTAYTPTSANMRIPQGVLRALPLIFAVGMFAPSMLMLTPLSRKVTSDMKQLFIAIWQPWPAYVAILAVAAHRVIGPFFSNADARKVRTATRHVYAFAFTAATLSHLIAVVVSGAAMAAPQIFARGYAASLHPSSVFETLLPWTTPALRVKTVAQGVRVFLRWDYLIGSTGVLVWAVSLYRAAVRATVGAEGGVCGVVDLVAKVLVLSVLCSPVGAAVELMWEREELFFTADGAERGKAKKTEKTEKKIAG